MQSSAPRPPESTPGAAARPPTRSQGFPGDTLTSCLACLWEEDALVGLTGISSPVSKYTSHCKLLNILVLSVCAFWHLPARFSSPRQISNGCNGASGLCLVVYASQCEPWWTQASNANLCGPVSHPFLPSTLLGCGLTHTEEHPGTQTLGLSLPCTFPFELCENFVQTQCFRSQSWSCIRINYWVF